jgi:hypothetical protein
MNPLTIEEILRRAKAGNGAAWYKLNVAFERECYEQACRELNLDANRAFRKIGEVAELAQKIKAQRRANGEGQ